MKKAPSPSDHSRSGSAAMRTTADLLREIEVLSARLAESQGRLENHRTGAAVEILDNGMRDHTREPAVLIQELLKQIRMRFLVEEELRESESRFRAIYENVPVGIALVDAKGRIETANPALASMLGVPQKRMHGRPFHEFLARGQELSRRRIYADLVHGKRPVADLNIRWTEQGGRDAWGRARFSLHSQHGDGSPRFLCTVIDVSKQKRLENSLLQNVHRQSSIADLGRLTLGGRDSSAILADAVSLVARQLRAPLCGYLEIAADRPGFVLRAAVGLGEGKMGGYRVGAGVESQSGFTLLTGGPVASPDLRSETRFRPAKALLDQGARSGLTVPVVGKDREPFGVLGVYSLKQRAFDPGETAFLVSAAHLLGLFLERDRIGKELADAKELLEKLFSNIHTQIAYLDTGFRFIRVNQAYAAAAGHDPEFYVGKSHFHLYPHAENEEIFRNVVATGKPFFAEGKPFEYPDSPDRGITYWDWSLVPVLEPDKTVSGLVLCLLDVTERRAAENNLRQSEERIRTLVDALPLGAFIVREGKIVFSNREVEPENGSWRDRDEFRKVLAVVPEDAERFEGFCAAMAREEGCTQSGEFRGESDPRNPRPTVQWFQVETSAIRFEKEKATLVLVIDITRAKEMEQHIIAREKLASLGAMTAGIAHEIRNPLSGIALYAGAIDHRLDRMEGIDPDTIDMLRTISRKIAEGTERIAQVTQRIMEFSRPASPVFVPVDINATVEEVARLLSSTLRLEKVKLRKVLTADLPVCQADPPLLRQALVNLVTNSLQAMREGKGARRLEIATSAANGQIFISIADSGTGVPAHLKEKIFDPFFSTKKGGFGIGLSFTRKILDDHGGRIRVDVSRWGGARFEIALPAGKRTAGP